MKYYSLIILFFLIACQSNKNVATQQRAQDFLHFIDSTTDLLGPPANMLVRYYKVIDSTLINGEAFLIENQTIDTLEYYYDALMFNYDNAIRSTNQFEEFDSLSASIKRNYLVLLEKGKEPWRNIIPVYLKVLRNGSYSISSSEEYIIDSGRTIFMNSSKVLLDWSRILGAQMEELEIKYHINTDPTD